MVRSTFYPSVFDPTNNITGPKTVHSDEKANNPLIENDLNTLDAKACEVQDALARSIVMRKIAPAMAGFEIHSTQLVFMAVDRTLTAAGNIAALLGAACLRAGERAHNATEPLKVQPQRGKARQNAFIETPDKVD